MNHKVQAYIDRINANDPALREIDLRGLNLGDTDIAALMTVLASKPNVAQQITLLNLAGNQLTSINIPATLRALEMLHLEYNQLTSINIPATLVKLQDLRLFSNQLTSINIPDTLVALQELYLNSNRLTSINIPATLVKLQCLSLLFNQLTSINIPETLVALKTLDLHNNQLTSINIPPVAIRSFNLSNNPLTMATKVALEALRHTSTIHYDNIIHPTQLTDDILHEHFKIMLRVCPEQIIAHFKKTGTEWLLSYLPGDLAGKISEYLEPIPEIERALASMANFQSIFSRLPMHVADNEQQLNILRLYNKELLQDLIKKTKNYYASSFESKTINNLGLFNEFLRENGFDSTDLDQKNAQGFTPLALAKANINIHPNDQNAKAIIPFIKKRTSYKGIMYHYLDTASRTACNHKELIATGVAMGAVAAWKYNNIASG